LKGKKNGWDKVFMHQDLTQKQRIKRQKVVGELKARIAQGETNLLIVNGKIVTRRHSHSQEVASR
jgi:hypothetical protein